MKKRDFKIGRSRKKRVCECGGELKFLGVDYSFRPHASCEDCPALIDGKTPEDHYHTDSCGYAEVLDLLHRQRHVLESGQA